MDLPLDPTLKIGIQTIHRRTEPAVGPWLPMIDEMHALVSQTSCRCAIRCRSPSRLPRSTI